MSRNEFLWQIIYRLFQKFFRRALKESSVYFCKYNHACVLNPRNRNSCRYCRYKKCMSVGMSRNGTSNFRKMRPQLLWCGFVLWYFMLIKIITNQNVRDISKWNRQLLFGKSYLLQITTYCQTYAYGIRFVLYCGLTVIYSSISFIISNKLRPADPYVRQRNSLSPRKQPDIACAEDDLSLLDLWA